MVEEITATIIHINVRGHGWIQQPISALRWAEGGFTTAAQRVLDEGITMVDVVGKHMVIPPSQVLVVMEAAPSPIVDGQQFKVAPEVRRPGE